MPTNTNRKYIICDAAPASWGKTTTSTELIKIFKSYPSAFTILSEHPVNPNDYWILLRENASAKTILIQTQGDYPSSYNETIKELSKEIIIDIIICAARSKGGSLKQVQYIANTYGYKQIHFSNFCPLNRSLFQDPVISNINKVHLAQLIFNFALAL